MSNKKSRSQALHDKPQLVPFHAFGTATLVAGQNAINLCPNTFAGPNSIADAYALYRFREVDFRLHPGQTRSGDSAAAMIPGAVDTPPSSLSQIGEVLNSCLLGVNATVPTEWVRCRKEDMSSYDTWYKTQFGTPDPIDEVQAAIYFVGNGVNVLLYEVRGVIEFKNRLSISNTPMLKKEQLMKMLLCRELSATSPVKSSNKPTAGV